MSAPSTALPNPHSPPSKLLSGLLLPVAMCIIVAAVSRSHFLLSHLLAELFSVVIAVTALVVANTSRRFTNNHFAVYIATVIGWCAVLDVIHTLSYKGMGLMFGDSANPATQFWIGARFLQATALLLAPLFLRQPLPTRAIHLAFGLYVVGISYAIGSDLFPDAFIDGAGLTPFKIYTEYLIIAQLALALWLFHRDRALMPRTLHNAMQLSLLLMMASEFAFTRYGSVYGDANLVGHLLKILAYWFVYVALVQHTLSDPFDMLARAASSYDAVPDPTLIVRSNGRIVQANRAAARRAGLAAEALVGEDSHALFHDPRLQPANCPICQHIAQGRTHLLQELAHRDGLHSYEYSVAPLTSGNERLHVLVVRDISERQRLAAEREQLVRDLRERIKELRCLHDLANLAEQPELDFAAVLRGAAELLPAAFLYPERMIVSIDSPWGHFGQIVPAHPPGQLSRALLCAGKPVGTLTVAFSEGSNAQFLPEESTLLDLVATRLSETIDHKLASARIRRQAYLYEMLSATNRAVVRCTSREELLESMFEALLTHGTFPMLFIALQPNPAQPMRVVLQQGLNSSSLELLHREIDDPNGVLAREHPALLTGHTLLLPVEHDAPPHSSGQYLITAQFHQRALLPLLHNGRLYGLIGLYSRDTTSFDADELRLLDEMATDVSFALENLANREQRQLAEAQARASEHRFQSVFEGSPLPMQIFSLSTRQLRACNHAFSQWLGYQLSDIPDEQSWLTQAYPDPQIRAQLVHHWEASLALARDRGEVIGSPELELYSKDGQSHQARGIMTIIGDDIIVAWTDLTEIRRSEQALRDSEQRFRGMIEQTLTGIYVANQAGLIYVNPRFCEIAGEPAEALIGRPFDDFIPADSEARSLAARIWQRLNDGEAAISLSLPFVRHDGTRIELGLHATRIDWDGQPALIAMVQDVTERIRSEEQIARYVGQLERSMKSTLEVVSKMVDLRDPYTAGHQRRVGQLAGAIAREMGWPEARCELMERIGLVHDIGKIAVPAEILSKPGRLSPVEMSLVRGHVEAGYQILRDIEFDAPIAEAIRQHHERLDGSGYPQGLKGEQILPEARVLAVADVLESMAAHRPYRPALGLGAALDELRRGSDSQYDAQVVAAVCRLLEEKGYTLPQ